MNRRPSQSTRSVSTTIAAGVNQSTTCRPLVRSCVTEASDTVARAAARMPSERVTGTAAVAALATITSAWRPSRMVWAPRSSASRRSPDDVLATTSGAPPGATAMTVNVRRLGTVEASSCKSVDTAVRSSGVPRSSKSSATAIAVRRAVSRRSRSTALSYTRISMYASTPMTAAVLSATSSASRARSDVIERKFAPMGRRCGVSRA